MFKTFAFISKTCLFFLIVMANQALALCEYQNADRIRFLPGLGRLSDCEYAGMLPLNERHSSSSSKLFYWYVQPTNQNAQTPVVLWLNGGPGASSLYGFLLENGPYKVTEAGQLSKRVDTWSSFSHYLIIDQPAGVGLSYGKKRTTENESQSIEQLSFAVNAFFKTYPSLKKHPFYLAGESYAGKTIPQLAMRLINQTEPLNLKGIIIGDGWVNPMIQLESDAAYAYSHGLISQKEKKEVDALYVRCRDAIVKSHPTSIMANKRCNQIQAYIQRHSGLDNMANIETGSEPDDKLMTRYLNRTDVRKALHVPGQVGHFSTFNEVVAQTLEKGIQDSMMHLYPPLLERGIQVLIYNGLADAKDANFMGTDNWLSKLSWSKYHLFELQAQKPVYFNKRVIAYRKSGGGLTQLKVLHAGHMAPADQPSVMAKLVSDFIQTDTRL